MAPVCDDYACCSQKRIYYHPLQSFYSVNTPFQVYAYTATVSFLFALPIVLAYGLILLTCYDLPGHYAKQVCLQIFAGNWSTMLPANVQ